MLNNFIIKLAQGGTNGIGNSYFKNSKNQFPKYFTYGKQGKIYHIKKVTSAIAPNDILYSSAVINNIESYEVFNVAKEETGFQVKDKIYELKSKMGIVVMIWLKLNIIFSDI